MDFGLSSLAGGGPWLDSFQGCPWPWLSLAQSIFVHLTTENQGQKQGQCPEILFHIKAQSFGALSLLGCRQLLSGLSPIQVA